MNMAHVRHMRGPSWRRTLLNVGRVHRRRGTDLAQLGEALKVDKIRLMTQCQDLLRPNGRFVGTSDVHNRVYSLCNIALQIV